jgi:osmotically inducible lipoprotein OsmB
VRRRTEVSEQKENNSVLPVQVPIQGASRFDFLDGLGEIIMNMTKRFSGMVLLLTAVALGGCAGMTRSEKSTATGAVIGGVVGNVLCGGVLCTGAGAAVGGVIGREAAK